MLPRRRQLTSDAAVPDMAGGELMELLKQLAPEDAPANVGMAAAQGGLVQELMKLLQPKPKPSVSTSEEFRLE